MDERWDKEAITKITATPWDLQATQADEEDVPKETQNETKPKEYMIEGAVPKQTQIRLSNLNKYGPTEGCPGCVALARRQKGVAHTPECRNRMEDAMLADPATAERVKKCRARIHDAAAEHSENALKRAKHEEGEAMKHPDDQDVQMDMPPDNPATEGGTMAADKRTTQSWANTTDPDVAMGLRRATSLALKATSMQRTRPNPRGPDCRS